LANTASAKKRIRSSARRRDRNRHYRAAARTYIRSTHSLLEKGEVEAAEDMAKLAASTLDKAARKGVLHRRNVSRRKGRLMKSLAAAQRSAADQ
jgi:small subunit ribosomal protein S20